MSTYTSSLGLEEITPGDQAGLWGNTTNNNLALIDQAITGVTPINFAGASSTVVTLTDLDGSISSQSRSAVLNITGIATGSNTIVVPNKQKTYLVRNNTGQDVIFRTATPTATYNVGAGNSILIFCDGNNNVFTGIASPSVGTLGVAGGGTGSTTFTAGFVKSTGGTNALTSASAVNLTSEVTGTLPVPSGGTGASSFVAGSLLIGNGTSNFGTLVGGVVGQVATWNGSQWTAQTPATGTVSSVFGRSGVVTAQSGDYSSFYPSLTGSGASGTWAINISGNAATATSATSATNATNATNATSATTATTATNVSGGSVSATTGSFSGQVSANSYVGGGIYNNSGNTVSLGFSNSPYVSVNTSNIFFPNADSTVSLGSGGNRWSIVYAANGTINTSDANEKQQIRDISAAEKAVAQILKGKLKAFKFNDAVAKKGDAARIHFGIIAQDIKAAFESQGLDPNKYGVFCSDTLDDGTVRLGVRYDELFALIIGSL